MALPPMRFVGHATVQLRVGGLTVVTDPVLGRTCSGLIRVVPAVDVPRADVVLISHLHADHLDLPSLRRLQPPIVVVPRGAAEWLRRKGFDGVVELGAGERTLVGDVEIAAVACVHDGHRWPSSGLSAEAVGYVIDDGDTRTWFAGDTDLCPSMRELGDLDLALVPVWGWGPNLGPGHLDPARAAEALEIVRPRTTVPIHWGTYAPPAVARFMRRQLTRPPLDFASAARGFDVRVLQPGDAL